MVRTTSTTLKRLIDLMATPKVKIENVARTGRETRESQSKGAGALQSVLVERAPEVHKVTTTFSVFSFVRDITVMGQTHSSRRDRVGTS